MTATSKKLVVNNADSSVLAISDISHFKRMGIKGAKAEAWLTGQGITLPATANSWVQANAEALVLRLGNSEFMFESQQAQGLSALSTLNQFATPGAYKVQRADAVFIISGSQALNLLSELCTLDLTAETLSENKLLMTQIAGISAILLKQSINGKDAYRVWCDGTYGHYMWETLLEIATELGGGAFESNAQAF